MSADCKILGLERLWSLGSRVCNETGTGWATGIILERYDVIQLCVGDTVAEANFDFGSIFLVDSWHWRR
jgi:hypothetical protein